MKTTIIINYFKECEANGIEPTLRGLYTYKLKCDAEAVDLMGSIRVVDADTDVINQYMDFCKEFNLKPVKAFDTAVKMYEIRDLKRVI